MNPTARWLNPKQQEGFPLLTPAHPTSPLGAQTRRTMARSVIILAVCGVLLARGLFLANAAPIDSVYDRSCTDSDCHPVNLHDPSLISHPSFLEQWCDKCHADHSSSNEGLLLAPTSELCLQCHAQTETHERTVLHPPNSGSCEECHSPHQSRFTHLLKEESMLLQCSECHAEQLQAAAELPFKHQFFSPQTECGSCHYAHQAGGGMYLRGNLGETCLTCHDMNIRVEGRSLENVGQEIRLAPYVHDPLRQDACHACHTPHGSVQSSLLRSDYPAGNYTAYESDNYRLCWSCHDSALVEDTETRDSTGFRHGSLNLHSLHVMQSKRGRACHLCHSAHASDRPHLIRNATTFGSWTGEFQFEVLPDGASCTTACHRPKEYDRSAP